jgi:Tol biopolymer transport system component
MNTTRKFWLVLAGTVLIMGMIACSCNGLAQTPTATPPPPQPSPTEEPPTLTPVPPTPFTETTGKIAFDSDRDGNNNIYVINTDGSNLTQLTDNQADNGCPAWSPDGQKIAFAALDSDKNSEIYIMNANGSDPTQLTHNKWGDGASPRGNCFSITWSPDGQKIAFTSFDSSEDTSIYVMNADGSNQTRLTDPTKSDDGDPAWSPDGQKIAFDSDGIYLMNADGSNQTRLTDPTKIAGADPAWSPDGQKIAFSSFVPPSFGPPGNTATFISVMNADGSNETQLNVVGEQGEPLAWSLDGQKIAFGSYENNQNIIYLVNADGSNPTPLTTSADGNCNDPSWSR